MKNRVVAPYIGTPFDYPWLSEINWAIRKLPTALMSPVWSSETFVSALHQMKIRMNWKFLAGIYKK